MTKAKSTTSSSSSSSSTSPASSTASSKNKVKKVTKKKAAKKKSPATKSKAKAKPKTKKLVGNALSSAVTTYLTASNRPHSEKEVWENMHKPTAQSKMKLLLVKMFFDSYEYLLLTIAIVSYYCSLKSIYKFSFSPVISLFVFITFGMFLFSFNGIRQSLAASIIFCFVDEEYWALIRSIQSVLYRSPPELIGEIILVDDGSTNPDMQESLEEYASLIPKLRIIRTGSRSGLIKARSIAARAAKFEVLTFLDSHIEVVPGWLEPLLQRLQEEPKNIVTPQIVVIDQNDLHFQSVSAGIINSAAAGDNFFISSMGSNVSLLTTWIIRYPSFSNQL